MDTRNRQSIGTLKEENKEMWRKIRKGQEMMVLTEKTGHLPN